MMTGLWEVSYAALWVVVLCVVSMLVGILHHIGALYESQPLSHPTNLRIGATIPDVELPAANGSNVRISQFAGQPVKIVLVKPTCSSCHVLLSKIPEARRSHKSNGRYVIISMGDRDGTIDMISKSGLSCNDSILIDDGGTIEDKWGAHTTPVTLVVDERLRLSRQVIGSLGEKRGSNDLMQSSE